MTPPLFPANPPINPVLIFTISTRDNSRSTSSVAIKITATPTSCADTTSLYLLLSVKDIWLFNLSRISPVHLSRLSPLDDSTSFTLSSTISCKHTITISGLSFWSMLSSSQLPSSLCDAHPSPCRLYVVPNTLISRLLSSRLAISRRSRLDLPPAASMSYPSDTSSTIVSASSNSASTNISISDCSAPFPVRMFIASCLFLSPKLLCTNRERLLLASDKKLVNPLILPLPFAGIPVVEPIPLVELNDIPTAPAFVGAPIPDDVKSVFNALVPEYIFESALPLLTNNVPMHESNMLYNSWSTNSPQIAISAIPNTCRVISDCTTFVRSKQSKQFTR